MGTAIKFCLLIAIFGYIFVQCSKKVSFLPY